MSKKDTSLHPRNKHQGKYNFPALIVIHPPLKPFVHKNKYNTLSIDFADPQAVKALNTALLKHYYQLQYWDVPNGYLCPPIPGRADYIHYIADLLGEKKSNSDIKALDIGCGANCIYPIIGTQEYAWSFVGTDVDATAIQSATGIVQHNDALKEKIELRLQKDKHSMFKNVVLEGERFDFSMCNPPFHESAEMALTRSKRKLKNLQGGGKVSKVVRNFGGQANELWYPGGEVAFIKKMIKESSAFKSQIEWFTSLVAREGHLGKLEKTLNRIGAKQLEIIPMGQGNKKSRILAWKF